MYVTRNASVISDYVTPLRNVKRSYVRKTTQTRDWKLRIKF